MSKPIFLLAFANDLDAYLPTIKRERKNISRTLRRHHDEGLIQVVAEANSSLEDIFELVLNYDNQLAIFHYGGHAGGTHLQLESADVKNQKAYAGGLAQLLGTQESLQLVFLNGCATKDQVELLLKAGVKAVIATAVPIQDKMATEFAEQFYNALASHTPIQRAFQIAKAFISAKYQKFEEIEIFRDVVFQDMDVAEKQEFPWGLYLNPAAEEVLSWSVPRRTSKKNILRTRFEYESRVDVNDLLIDIICEDVARYNPDLDYELNKQELDIPSIKREIIDSFPTPIGEHLRKLFTRSNNPEEPDDMELFTIPRLRQLGITYRTSMQFICFILLSQLWDEKHKNQDLEIGEDYIVDFNSFFALGPTNFESFDYVKLINTITEIFDDYQIPYFIDELKDLQINSAKDHELYEAYVFMNGMYESLLDDSIDAEAVEGLCLEAEQHLGIVLKEIAFLVKYKLVTIKNIELIKNRHESPRFQHNQITLNQALTVANTGISEVGIVFDNFTDNKSVLFIKADKGQVSGYLNLTPFIIDENALNNDYASKLFLYAFQDQNQYAYQFLNNLGDEPLKADREQYENIKSLFDRFKAEIFGQEYLPPAEAVRPKLTSRFSQKR